MELNAFFSAAGLASRELAALPKEKIVAVLHAVADAAVDNCAAILFANAMDLAKMSKTNPLYDRLLLSRERIEAIAEDMRTVAELYSPLGEILHDTVRPNGMNIRKVRVPFGVIGVIYEARPNVSFDVFALCFKTGNVALLKGSKDAENSNKAIADIIRATLRHEGVNENALILLPVDRESTEALLHAVGYVDLVIPRGSASLIQYVRDTARVPVIETGAGICHTYIDSSADIIKARDIVCNAKTRRVSVCNALDCMIIHTDVLENIAEICAPLAMKKVLIHADEASFALLSTQYDAKLLIRADTGSYGTEFLDYIMSIKVVTNIDEAIEHIAKYSSKHSEAIVAESEQAIEYFTQRVDAACVYANVSTAFTDGAQFGFGAEIGISTQKLHARGPMALAELTSYKYIIRGDGQIRT